MTSPPRDPVPAAVNQGRGLSRREAVGTRAVGATAAWAAPSWLDATTPGSRGRVKGFLEQTQF